MIAPAKDRETRNSTRRSVFICPYITDSHARRTTLVCGKAGRGVASIDGWAARQQRMVALCRQESAQQRIDIELIAGGSGDRATGCVADEVVPVGGDRTVTI